MAYADNVPVISGTEVAQEVVSAIEQYTEASGSKKSTLRRVRFSGWLRRVKASNFRMPSQSASRKKKVLGIKSGPGDHGYRNWERRLVDANAKVAS